MKTKNYLSILLLMLVPVLANAQKHTGCFRENREIHIRLTFCQHE